MTTIMQNLKETALTCGYSSFMIFTYISKFNNTEIRIHVGYMRLRDLIIGAHGWQNLYVSRTHGLLLLQTWLQWKFIPRCKGTEVSPSPHFHSYCISYRNRAEAFLAYSLLCSLSSHITVYNIVWVRMLSSMTFLRHFNDTNVISFCRYTVWALWFRISQYS